MSTTRPAPSPRATGDRCPGALRLHEADDGFLARVRLPGGLLDAAQVLALADAAEALGDGYLRLTARGNVEIRGLGEDAGLRLSAVLSASGLLPSATHERVRNIVATPAAGLDGHSHSHSGSLVDVVRRTDRLLCETPRAADLSGRFLLGLDDGRGDVLALQPDVAARWIDDDLVEIVLGGTPVLLFPAAQAHKGVVAAAVAFLDARDEAGETGWRLAELASPARVIAHVVDALFRAFPKAEPTTESTEMPASTHPRASDPSNEHASHDPSEPLAPGPLGESSLNVVLRLGSAPAATWRALAAAAQDGDGLVRTTPARSVVLGGLSASARENVLSRAASLGLIVDPRDPAFGVSACTGLPGCASSARDVRADVEAALAPLGPDSVRQATEPRLPLHVSGCDRRCGHPRRPHHEAVARSTPGSDVAPYATALADGRPATGAPLGDGRDDLAQLIAPTGTPAPAAHAPEDAR